MPASRSWRHSGSSTAPGDDAGDRNHDRVAAHCGNALVELAVEFIPLLARAGIGPVADRLHLVQQSFHFLIALANRRREFGDQRFDGQARGQGCAWAGVGRQRRAGRANRVLRTRQHIGAGIGTGFQDAAVDQRRNRFAHRGAANA
jgi:hypothetical protein